MLLSPSESDRFLSLYKPLLLHGNQLFPILKKIKTITDLEASSFQEFYQLRENLYEHLEVFDSFSRDRLTATDLEAIPIVEAWKTQHVRGKFCLLRHLKSAIENADAARLKAYLKTECSREDYWDEIVALKEKSPELRQLYAQEIGKVYQRNGLKTPSLLGRLFLVFNVFLQYF